jgi:uncharacterized membrane protein YfcA
MLYDWQFLLLLAIGVLITGISKSGFAGGVGVVAVPLLSLKTSPVNAAAIMLPLLIVMDAFSLKAWWGKKINRLLLIVFPPAILGVLIGYLTFGYLNEQMIKLSLGVFSMLFGIWGLLPASLKRVSMPPLVGGICGGIAGLTSFIAHAGGPPLNFYLLNQKLSKPEFLATAVVFLAGINLVKIIPYFSLGMINMQNMLPALLFMPLAWLGVRLGLAIQKKIDGKYFFNVILIMLILLGIKLIVDGACLI